MSGPEEPTRAEGLVPPRPNLGPEPWPDRPGGTTGLGWWGVALGLLLVLALARWRRRLNARPADPDKTPDHIDTPEPTPRQRLIAASEGVRDALIAAFGPAWASKTTEDIAADPAPSGRLGPDDSERLIEFLRLADRAKFAGESPKSVEDWEGWAVGFRDSLAGATSRISGK